jgi:CMP-N,N'-diacetyllegionaminic acid synthase
MKVLGVITARGGSKGVPRKNITLLAGRPLLSYTAVAALEAARLDRVILSTDDDEIAAVGEAWGIEVPFRRPAALSGDDTPTLPVLQHAVRWVEDMDEHYDAICLLQPTNPFRKSGVIDACIELLMMSGADSVVTTLPIPTECNPHWAFERGPDGFLRLATGELAPIPRRQILPPAYRREGSVYVTRRDVIMNENSLLGRRIAGYPLDPLESVNIDTPEDLDRAHDVAKQLFGEPVA